MVKILCYCTQLRINELGSFICFYSSSWYSVTPMPLIFEMYLITFVVADCIRLSYYFIMYFLTLHYIGIAYHHYAILQKAVCEHYSGKRSTFYPLLLFKRLLLSQISKQNIPPFVFVKDECCNNCHLTTYNISLQRNVLVPFVINWMFCIICRRFFLRFYFYISTDYFIIIRIFILRREYAVWKINNSSLNLL